MGLSPQIIAPPPKSFPELEKKERTRRLDVRCSVIHLSQLRYNYLL